MVLIYLAVNVSSIRAFRTGFRDDFRFCRHPLISATAIAFLLFPFWGFFTRGRTLMDLLPFAALGWLCLGVIAASVRRTSPAGGITHARVTTFHDGPTGWSHEFRRF